MNTINSLGSLTHTWKFDLCCRGGDVEQCLMQGHKSRGQTYKLTQKTLHNRNTDKIWLH